MHLSPLEELAYRRLLDMYYDTEMPIPLETGLVSRRIRLGIETVEIVLNEFFERTETGYRNSRCDSEIMAYRRKAEQARTNGKSGGRPNKTNPVPTENRTGTGSKANQEPITNISTTNVVDKNPVRKKPEKFDPFSIAIPSELDKGKWVSWIRYRTSLPKKLKPETWERQIAFLLECRAKGHDPGEIIDASIRNGWQGLFEPKSNAGKTAYVSDKDASRRKAYLELTGRTEHEHRTIDLEAAAVVKD